MAAYRCKFDTILVVDFATTIQENTFDFPPEIIQFSVSVMDVKNKRIREDIVFNEYCKPTIAPQLTEGCIRTTGVQQENVDSAKSFKDVYDQFATWIRDNDLEDETVAVACLSQDTLWKNAQYQFILNKRRLPGIFRQWFDVSHRWLYYTKQPLHEVPRNYLPEMAAYYKTDLEGEVFDSRNNTISLVRILKKMLDIGVDVYINSQLSCYAREREDPMYLNESIVWQRDPRVFYNMAQRILPLMFVRFYRSFAFSIENYGMCPWCHQEPRICKGLEHKQFPNSLFRSLRLTTRPVSTFAEYLDL